MPQYKDYEYNLAGLAEVAKDLKIASAAMNEQDVENLQEIAADIAEYLEVVFVYENGNKEVNTYTPQSLWESSNCEWEQSAYEGYDYGWNI